eukprot:CAMPEP_0179448172 /NCGR_PEP_ID=MMETSP0799-20121207/31985_1 /TAXON_ID=46947 /ORGANISM="Geminigera cryophila, Strain CCMP2564" /LENGTH=70 /DNA_ID=CAMNT_0021239683 /DNA_START=136 /DNA_END=344 /DNA_ORIENTATION=+
MSPFMADGRLQMILASVIESVSRSMTPPSSTADASSPPADALLVGPLSPARPSCFLVAFPPILDACHPLL